MLPEACIIGAPFYQTCKPNINVATRVCALATKAVNSGQQRLSVLNQAQMRVSFVYTKDSVDFQIQTVDILKSEFTTFMHNLPELSNLSKLLNGFHRDRILQT